MRISLEKEEGSTVDPWSLEWIPTLLKHWKFSSWGPCVERTTQKDPIDSPPTSVETDTTTRSGHTDTTPTLLMKHGRDRWSRPMNSDTRNTVGEPFGGSGGGRRRTGQDRLTKRTVKESGGPRGYLRVDEREVGRQVY